MPSTIDKKIDKEFVIKSFIEKFESELSALVSSAKAAHAAATHEESKAEDRHDTFAIEASYLAAGQATRVAELEKTIQEFDSFLAHRTATRLITYTGDGNTSHALFANSGGGSKIQIGTGTDQVTIQVLSLKSPLGEELSHGKEGEEITFENRGVEKTFRIVKSL